MKKIKVFLSTGFRNRSEEEVKNDFEELKQLFGEFMSRHFDGEIEYIDNWDCQLPKSYEKKNEEFKTNYFRMKALRKLEKCNYVVVNDEFENRNGVMLELEWAREYDIHIFTRSDLVVGGPSCVYWKRNY